METIRVAGIDCQNLPVDPFGLGQAAGPVVPESLYQQAFDGRRLLWLLPLSFILFGCDGMLPNHSLYFSDLKAIRSPPERT